MQVLSLYDRGLSPLLRGRRAVGDGQLATALFFAILEPQRRKEFVFYGTI